LLLHPSSLIEQDGSHNVVIFQDAVTLSLLSKQVARAVALKMGEKGEVVSKT